MVVVMVMHRVKVNCQKWVVQETEMMMNTAQTLVWTYPEMVHILDQEQDRDHGPGLDQGHGIDLFLAQVWALIGNLDPCWEVVHVHVLVQEQDHNRDHGQDQDQKLDPCIQERAVS